METHTYHITEALSEAYPEISQLIEAARYHEARSFAEDFRAQWGDKDAEAASEQAAADEEMWAALDAALQAEIDEAVVVEVRAIEAHFEANAVLVDLASWPEHEDQTRRNSLAGTTTTTLSDRRKGKRGVSYARSLKEAGRRLRGLFQTEKRDGEGFPPEWHDLFAPPDLDLLVHGDPHLGLGPCVIDPADYLDLWASCLRSAQ